MKNLALIIIVLFHLQPAFSAPSGLPGGIVISTQEAISGDTTFIYDDGSVENGFLANPGVLHWFGNLFPVPIGTTGVLKSFEVYFYHSSGSTQELSIDVFNSSYELIGSSAAFAAESETWISVNVSDIPFSGPFYAMVKWDKLANFSYFLGLDNNGPYVNLDLARYIGGIDVGGIKILSELYGASAKGSFLVRAHAAMGPAGIEDMLIDDLVSVFPNPAKSHVEISSPEGLTSVKIVDLSGKTLLNYPGEDERKLQIDLTGINNGLYLLWITTTKGMSVHKISVFH